MSKEIEIEGQPYTVLNDDDIICEGDLVLDCGGKWRGPIYYDWDGVGGPVSKYTNSSTPDIQAAARCFARPLSRSTGRKDNTL